MAEVTLTLDDALLERIDRCAAAEGLTRDAYVARTVEGVVNGDGRLKHSAGVREALARLDKLFEDNPTPGGDSTALFRAMRDAL